MEIRVQGERVTWPEDRGHPLPDGRGTRLKRVTSVPRPDCSPLDAALARAMDSGRTVAFWWRDDDAVAHTRALDQLLTLASRLDLPLALASIPAKVESSLVDRIRDEARIGVLVHGLRHANHAPPVQPKAEFCLDRSLERLSDDAATGLRMAQARFGARVSPIFVPPWNRAAPALVAILPTLGFRGLSTFGDRAAREPAPGLIQVNAHIDPIAWRSTRSLADPDALIAGLARTIEQQLRTADDPEPIGVLTHHLIHDEAVWGFCTSLLERLASHPASEFPPTNVMFSAAA